MSDVVSSNVREQVDFAVFELPLDDDPSQGFLVLDIPASAHAPHMVETKVSFGSTAVSLAVIRFWGKQRSLNCMPGAKRSLWPRVGR